MKLLQPITVQELASILQASFVGQPNHMVTGINEIHVVESGDITFVDHPKYYNKALNSQATTILINKQVEPPPGKALIISDDPFGDFNKLILRYRSFEPATHMISPSASIGEGTHLQPGVFIGNHVRIGKNCVIHANVSIYDHCVIGNNVIIHSNTVIGADGFYFQRRSGAYRKFHSCGRVVIEDEVEIGACCTIDRGVTGDTTIGRGTKFDNHIQIGHDTVVGKNCLLASAVAIAGVVEIEDDVILWGQVAVQKDLVIKKGAIVLGQSGVIGSLEGNKVYFGTPATEAKRKWREIASVKQLPEIIQKLR
ncbi:MAG TPA: UDP-3-O-(3-hydroxymyristoyl)glucosamine N-acyltransferase [Bacteroidales bacterium]|nr:UDP-3-O-(3-hydroxymyristoyl)glucosamine N-acyltransferase [Bacteroidales bacterium]